MTTTHVLQHAHATASPPRSPTSPLVQARSLTRVWGKGDSAQIAVDHVDLAVERGELVAIVGPSGSGKSTLGSLVAGLDRPTAGSIVVDDVRLDELKDDALAQWRASNVGIVFQNFHLIPTLTAAENVGLGLRFGPRTRHRREQASEALASVGLGGKTRRLPSQLSGGEQQRVGIARAIVRRPPLIVADEPTGNLDTASGRVVFDLISQLRDTGTSIVFITHDPDLAQAADRTVTMVDGQIVGVQR